ncbi:hypothetical protein [Marinicella sp. W31]|uniref:hypothetical protein n=1 Tax=Marinicella sp. W31 TaxID=3023713 RepID=UPI003756D630
MLKVENNKQLENLILKFSDFLNLSADLIVEFNKRDSTDVFLRNWLQANWEMIVEHFLSQEDEKLVLLCKYGEGADETYYSLSDEQEFYERVSLPSMPPTHKIICSPKNEEQKCFFSGKLINFPEEGLEFNTLISIEKEGLHAEYKPPFDKVLLKQEPYDVVVPIKDLNFTLVKNN